MKIFLNKFIIFLFVFAAFSAFGQNHKYYLRAIDNNFNPRLILKNGKLDYTGKDKALKAIFDNNNIFVFEKAFIHSKNSNLLRVFSLESDSSSLLALFLQNTSHIFEYGEHLGNEVETLASYPNDYGQTGGTNQGLNVNMSNFDFIEVPQAWEYTVGNKNINVGISDGGILNNDAEFANRITVLTNSTANQDHGVTTTAIAAAKGNNAYGTTGICYGCNIISTIYGDYDRLIEMSYSGAKIINCSWGSYNNFSQIQQDAIDEIYQNGSVIVAASHNEPWSVTQGNWFNYPSSYNHVISVGSVAHKYETPTDSLLTINGNYFAIHVKNHVGKSLAFDENPIQNPDASYHIIKESTNTLNSAVDILAPGGLIFQYGWYFLENQFYIMIFTHHLPHLM